MASMTEIIKQTDKQRDRQTNRMPLLIIEVVVDKDRWVDIRLNI